MKLFYALCILFSINVSMVSMKHIFKGNQIKPEAKETIKSSGQLYSVGVTLSPTKDGVDAVLRQDFSVLFDEVLAEVQQWIKISTNELNDNIKKVSKLIDEFLGYLKEIQPNGPVQESDTAEVKLEKYVLVLIKESTARTLHMLQLIDLDPNASESDIEEYKNRLLNFIHITYMNAKDVYWGNNIDRKKVLTETLDIVNKIDVSIQKLNPSTSVGKIFQSEGTKIIKQIEVALHAIRGN